MFLGHFGVAFGLKKTVPLVSLGTLFLAAQFVDLLWPTLLLLGLEHVTISPGITKVVPLDFVDYPISHSLLTTFLWAGLFSAVYFLIRKNRIGAVICGIAVLSHWVLDLFMHRPDLPLIPGGDLLVGLGGWNNLWLTLTVELLIFGAGAWLYLKTTRAVDRTGSIGLWALLTFFVVVYMANIFGDPPPNTTALAWVGQAQWVLVLWGYWIDRHRSAVNA